MSSQYQQLVDLGNDKKLVAAAEVGSAPSPDMLQAYHADWLWFCVWGDSYINNNDWNSLQTLTEVRRICTVLARSLPFRAVQ